MNRQTQWKAWAALLLLVHLCLPVLALAATEAGKVLATRGEVSATAADGQSRALKRGDVLFQGDTILTGADSFVRIRFTDGGSLHLRAATRFAIADYAFEEQGRKDVGRFDLVAGGFRAVTGAIGREEKPAYTVKTPVTTIGIRGTDHEARYCKGDCTDLQEQGVPPPEDGLYNGTFVGETVINGVVFGPGQYGYTNPEGVTIRLPEPPAILTGDPMPDPSDDAQYEGLGADQGGLPAGEEGRQIGAAGDTTSGDGDEVTGAAVPGGDGGPPGGEGGAPGGGAAPGGEPGAPGDGSSTGAADGGTSADGTTVTDGTEGQEERFASNPDTGFFYIPPRDQQVVILECPI